MKIVENILLQYCRGRKVLKTVFKQIRKITSPLPLLLCTLSFVLVQSCNTTEPGNNKNLTLSVEDVSSTEAWLKLKTENILLPANITLLQNNNVGQVITLSKPDTIIFVDSLLPNKNYTFQTSGIGNPVTGIRSNKVNATTLDTTSNNVTWQQFTFGGEAGATGSSNIWDVAIVNDTSIWAVGAIYLKDSTGQPDPAPYNLARWDGQKWNLERIYYIQNDAKFINPIKSVFAFNDNDIWFGNFTHWNGNTFESIPLNISFPSDVNKIWGTSCNDLYIVGNGGNIAHYQKGSWSKIESGTDIRLTDIYGTPDGKNIWACGWDNSHPNSIILKINPTSISKIIWDGISLNGEYQNSISTLWSNGGEYWIAGGFIYTHSLLFHDHGHLVRTKGYKLFDPGNFTLRTRGTEKNNIFLAGDLGMLWHFNGVRWHKYSELYNEQFDRRLNTIDVKGKTVVAAGWKGAKAWIIIGE